MLRAQWLPTNAAPAPGMRPIPPWTAARGWGWRGDRLAGAYWAGEARYRGEIRFTDDGMPVPYVMLAADTPCLRGSHAACFFVTLRPGCYRVHFAVEPFQNSVDDTIRAVEAVLR